MLQPIVSDGRSGLHCSFNVSGFNELPLSLRATRCLPISGSLRRVMTAFSWGPPQMMGEGSRVGSSLTDPLGEVRKLIDRNHVQIKQLQPRAAGIVDRSPLCSGSDVGGGAGEKTEGR